MAISKPPIEDQDETTRSKPTLEDRGKTPAPAWYRTITRSQWNALVAAQLGWMLDAMDFVLYLMAIRALMDAFGLTTAQAGLLASVALVTSAAGGLLFGVVADYFGRARALMATILIYSFATLGTATAQDFTQLMIWRAAVGIGMGGEWSSGAVLVSETWPAEHRGKAIGIMQSGWALGYILAALAAAAILPAFGWRWLFAIGVAPALFVFWVRRNVHEPDVWSAEREKADPSRITSRSNQVNTLAAIFSRALIGRTLKATLLTSLVMFGYWGFFTWLPGFLATSIEQGGAGMSIVKSTAWIIPTQIGAFFGYLSFGFISDRLGRRPTFIAFLLAAAILVPVYGHMARSPLALMVTGPLLGFFSHGFFSVFGAMLSELFKTSVRATAQGFIYNAGRVLGGLAPYTIGTLAMTRGLGPALALTSAFFIAGALLMLTLPETRGRQIDR
jgi:putative sialic acid transporter